MTKKVRMLAGTVAAAAALGTAGFLTTAHAQVYPSPYQAQRGMQRRHDRDPRLIRALRLLQQARQALQRADADSQGFRVKAISEVDEAIQDTHEAIRHDQ